MRVEKLRAESDLEESELYESCGMELKQLRCEHLKLRHKLISAKKETMELKRR